MEPWLDSLSEDWNSEPHLSSPTSSFSSTKKHGTQTSRSSQSRIPYLSQSVRGDVSGSFLKPRSSRGIAKASGGSILSERSASSLNLPNSPHDGSQKRRMSSLPRRASSTFSESQTSVQRHSVNSTSKQQGTPEWKKRLINGEDIASDGLDLFSPSKLEGIFTEPVSKTDETANQSSLLEGNSRPWGSLKVGQLTSSSEQHRSLRARSHVPMMEALHEVNEDEEDYGIMGTNPREDTFDQDMSAISSDVIREGSLRGLVRRRVGDLEQMPVQVGDADRVESKLRDPRWRTFSGQVEIKNELISPVTVSARNTIRDRAVIKSVELDPQFLSQRLTDVGQRRPSSRSSDRDVSYTTGHDDSILEAEHLPEMTSHSLPEDLSMGTQDFMSNGGFINHRRGAGSTDASFMRRKLSSIENSHFAEQDDANTVSSSPPLHNSARHEKLRDEGESVLLPELPSDASVVRHSPSPTRPSSGGSPLKLFGNRDTFTNNKLMRILNHYGQDASTQDESAGLETSVDQQLYSESELRMSHFGNGELDSFHFAEDVQHPQTADPNQLKALGKHPKSSDQQTVDRHRKRSTSRQAAVRLVDDNPKRLPSSPAKDRTPKRRRTLLKDEIVIQGVGVEVKVDQLPDAAPAVAGKKRKDARPGESGSQADARILASRSILRPKVGSRKSSINSQLPAADLAIDRRSSTPAPALTEALAAELESFAKGVSEAHQDSRKPSLATKDYMEEANKVMEFIRARGKPRTMLSGIHEPDEASALNSDDILDLEIDDDSTKESFSRPPSRDRPLGPREDRRIAKHTPLVENQLNKYREPDDLELLTSTSAIGTLHVVDNRAASDAARVPIPEEKQESSPENIRILNLYDKSDGNFTQNESLGNEPHQSSIASSKHTFPTTTSSSSGQKGVIQHGTVSIPESIGTMTFDREKQIWIKQKLAQLSAAQDKLDRTANSAKEVTLDDDPFEGIPDLSIDETREAAIKDAPSSSSHKPLPDKQVQDEPASTCGIDSGIIGDIHIEQALVRTIEPFGKQDETCSGRVSADQAQTLPILKSPKRSEISAHEIRLHQGFKSTEPDHIHMRKGQPRAVTIAFSSPIVSEIRYPKSSEIEVDNDDDFLPPEDSDYEDYVPTPKASSTFLETGNKPKHMGGFHGKKRSMVTTNLMSRPISRIDELDEDASENEGLSLVRVQEFSAQDTPQNKNVGTMQATPGYKGSSILCLTPLSEFTMHQADAAAHGDASFIAARPHPKALLQAHGTLALSKDELVKAITDATADEPFWEQVRRLDLSDSKLASLNALQDYCPVLEELAVGKNNISQLAGLPPSLRRIEASMNLLNDFTSWTHLHNLQLIDVSGNQLECLEAFSSLIHLRDLRARNNKIRDIEGILDLDGLISLDLSGNHLVTVDFEGAELSQLKKLDLSDNRLTSVQNLHCLPRLEQLYLAENSLRELAGPAALANVKLLDAAHNELESLDLTILPSLEELDVDSNSIRSFQGLSASDKLRRLSAREQKHCFDLVNVILRTPNECSALYLSSNMLADGQLVLPEYPHYNLRHLELAGCGMRTLPKAFGDYFPNCRKLNLNFNAISDLSQIVGCIKMDEILLAGNRINRLRRTCVALSRLARLQSLDIRDNPLTIGFYPPATLARTHSDVLTLPTRCAKSDSKWSQVLDEVTMLKRRTIELLLAEKCENLSFFNGSTFDRQQTTNSEVLWASLTTKGVLAIPTAPSPNTTVLVELPEAGPGNATPLAPMNLIARRKGIDEMLSRERSLVVE